MAADRDFQTFTIVIPALDEEEAIGGTISQCLEAREQIQRAAGLEQVEIIVVSDGSTDRTAEIARGFDDVTVVVFEHNRGYGAAIKAGFSQGSGELVGFIDADGTCDPRSFADLCRVIVEDDVDMALGSRLGPTSRMPRVRRLGNRIFAVLLGLLCGRQVIDTASGMRVIKRSALVMLCPLPDGLDFTPAMSARAMLNGLRVAEIPTPYEERIGTSKLSVLRDGFRFLRTILAVALCYRPERLFLMGFVACLLLGLLLAAYPAEFYFHNQRLEEWMIYRFVACVILAASGFLFLSAASLAHRMAYFGPRVRDGSTFWAPFVANIFEGRTMTVFVAVTLGATLWALWPGLIEFIPTRRITLHWSRLLAGAFGMLVLVQTLVTHVLMRVLAMWQVQHAEVQRYQREQAETTRRSHSPRETLRDHHTFLDAFVSNPPRETPTLPPTTEESAP